MNKSELVAKIAESSDISKRQAGGVLDSALSIISNELAQKGQVAILGFGTFEVKERSARTGRNPQNGQPMEIKAATVPGFRPGKALKDAMQ